MYHPDRFADQPEKQATYTQLTSAINKARDEGNIALLREIANAPHGFILRSGLSGLDFDDAAESKKLRRLLDTLQVEIVATLEMLNALHASPEYELHALSAKEPNFLDEVAAKQRVNMDLEIADLESRAESLQSEISELTGSDQELIA